ncbi:MAG: hypothetical protein ICV52_10895, partial [Microcoleus sp. C1-bin4]|nr:hypothetical protein [Microcoleus sp. C1-bin4]
VLVCISTYPNSLQLRRRGSLTQQLVRSLKHVDLHLMATETSGLCN